MKEINQSVTEGRLLQGRDARANTRLEKGAGCVESLAKRMESNAKAYVRGNSALDINSLYKHLYTDPNLRIRMVLQFIIVEGGLIL